MANLPLFEGLRQGAIVYVETNTDSVYSGKIKELTDEYLVLIPQLFIRLKEPHVHTAQFAIDQFASVDSKESIQVKTTDILGWFFDSPSYHENDEDIRSKCLWPIDISPDSVVNFYNKHGYCHGNGPFLEV